MSYGPTTTFSLNIVDKIAPGAPALISVTQIDNTIVRIVMSMPTMDSGTNGNLTGLTKITICSLMQSGTTNPFTGKTMSEIIAMSGITKVDLPLTMSDAGVQKQIDFPVISFGTQLFCAACSD